MNVAMADAAVQNLDGDIVGTRCAPLELPGYERATALAAQLECLFDIWVVEPAASVIDSPNGIDLLANCGSYAPEALADIYAHLEQHLAAVLAPAMRDKKVMSAREIAYILRVATTGVKASADKLPELRKVVAGMIKMALATVQASK